MLDPTKIVQFVAEHKLVIAGVLGAAAAPSLIMAIPDAYEAATSLPSQAQYAIGSTAAVLAGGAAVVVGRRSGRTIGQLSQRLGELVQRRKLANDHNLAFVKGGLPGADKVVMVERSAGNISNVSLERSTLPPALQEEMAAAMRTVAVIGDTSPGLLLEAQPILRKAEAGQMLAEFKKSPVRDDIRDAVRRTQMWLPRQEPALLSFLNGCERQVVFHIAAPGCTSLTDSLDGFGGLVRGTEANMHIYVHDPREEAVPCEADSIDLANGHREFAEIPVLVAAGGVPNDADMDYPGGRPVGRRHRPVDHRDFEEQLLGLETELYKQAGQDGDRVFLISNFNGVKQNSAIRRTIDIMESACLRNYHPLDSGSTRATWPDHADVSHILAGPWQPSVPLSFGDSHAALVTAKEITSGLWESQFYGFAPDQVPLELRKVATTFVTGNPRAGQAFIEALDGALPIPNTVVAHWNERSPAVYAVFCVPAFPAEIESTGLRFPPKVFGSRTG